MKINDVFWFTPATGECIGIVYGTDDVTGERKAYIGVGNGINEEEDIALIAKTGAKFILGVYMSPLNP